MNRLVYSKLAGMTLMHGAPRGKAAGDNPSLNAEIERKAREIETYVKAVSKNGLQFYKDNFIAVAKTKDDPIKYMNACFDNIKAWVKDDNKNNDCGFLADNNKILLSLKPKEYSDPPKFDGPLVTRIINGKRHTASSGWWHDYDEQQEKLKKETAKKYYWQNLENRYRNRRR